MTLGRFDNPSASDIGAGLVPVPPPIRASDVAAVRTNYGIGASFKPKGQSDSSLYGHSVKFVIDWWKRNKAAAGTGAVPGGGTGTGGGGTGTGGGGTSGSGGIGAATQATAVVPKPVSFSPSSYMAPTAPAATAPRVGGLQVTEGVSASSTPIPTAQPIKSTPTPQSYPNITSNITGTVSRATAQSIMTQMGLKNATPPASAMTSTTALRAWATKMLADQQKAAASRSQMARKGAV